MADPLRITPKSGHQLSAVVALRRLKRRELLERLQMHGFQKYWGYLYHLDAMQGVSFPDLKKNATTQTIAPPSKNTPIPGVPEPDLCEARDFWSICRRGCRETPVQGRRGQIIRVCFALP
jgi:hypothetical protein